MQVDEEVIELKSEEQTTTSKSSNKNRFKHIDLNIVIFLVLLYVIQGIPMGVASSIPLILSSRKVSYWDQGIYSFAQWPFSIRLLWAPLVDRFFINKIGRRKSWIIMCQLLSGLIMLSHGIFLNKLFETPSENNKNNIYFLTLIFGSLVFLSATNDIVLDAWSLDLLNDKNVSYQAICNYIGMGIGQFVGNSGFLMFESANFSNKLREFFKLEKQNFGLITIEKFMIIFGSVSTIVSILIFLFKNEYNLKKVRDNSTEQVSVKENEIECKKRSIFYTYKCIWDIFLIKHVRIWIFLIITHRFAFSPESVFRIKLVEKGFLKEKLSFLNLILSPILSLLPIIIAKLINGPKPLNLFRLFFLFKLVMIALMCTFLYFISNLKDEHGSFSFFYYIILFILNLIDGFFSFATSIALGGFNARISDRMIGGTYMTFLSFWQSLGANFSKTSILFLVNFLTFIKCDLNENVSNEMNRSNHKNVNLTCPEQMNKNKCAIISNNITNNITYNITNNITNSISNKISKNKCDVILDPYYLITVLFLIYGVVWLITSKKWFKYIQNLAKSEWKIKRIN